MNVDDLIHNMMRNVRCTQLQILLHLISPHVNSNRTPVRRICIYGIRRSDKKSSLNLKQISFCCTCVHVYMISLFFSRSFTMLPKIDLSDWLEIYRVRSFFGLILYDFGISRLNKIIRRGMRQREAGWRRECFEVCQNKNLRFYSINCKQDIRCLILCSFYWKMWVSVGKYFIRLCYHLFINTILVLFLFLETPSMCVCVFVCSQCLV